MHPSIRPPPFQLKQQPQNIERGLSLKIEQDEEEFGFYALQSRFSAPASSSFSRLGVTLDPLLIGRAKDLTQRVKGFPIQTRQCP
jgi:hypothetical protein